MSNTLGIQLAIFAGHDKSTLDLRGGREGPAGLGRKGRREGGRVTSRNHE